MINMPALSLLDDAQEEASFVFRLPLRPGSLDWQIRGPYIIEVIEQPYCCRLCCFNVHLISESEKEKVKKIRRHSPEIGTTWD